MQIFKRLLQKAWYDARENNDRALISMIDFAPDTLLDLGCDDGALMLRVVDAVKAKRVVGVEIDKGQAQKAASSGLEVVVSDLNGRVALEDSFADVVTANQLIEHVANTDNLLQEIWRLLRRNGVAVVATENLSSWHNIFALLLGWQPFSLTQISSKAWQLGNPLALHTGEKALSISMQHVRVFSYRGLAEVFRAHGFTVEKIVGAGYYPFTGRTARLLSRLDPRHSPFIIIKASKGNDPL